MAYNTQKSKIESVLMVIMNKLAFQILSKLRQLQLLLNLGISLTEKLIYLGENLFKTHHHPHRLICPPYWIFAAGHKYNRC